MNRDAEALFQQINKEMGEGTATKGSDLRVHGRFPTGSLSLDVSLGGGWAGGQWSEIIGWESSGKTAVVLKTVAANQAADPDFTTLWIAAEHYDAEWAAKLGVDNGRVIVVSTNAMEFVYDTIIEFARSKSVNLIVLDSYPALVTDEEDEKDMDEASMAIGARLTGKFFRKIPKEFRRMEDERPIFGLFINQWRDAIGTFSRNGKAKTSPGGNAKNFAFYTRVEVSRVDFIEESRPGKGKEKVGQEIKTVTVKNKAAPPRQVAHFDFYFRDAQVLGFYAGEIDDVKELSTLGIVYDVITRRGAYFDIGEQHFQGKAPLLQALREDMDLREEVRAKITEIAGQPDRLQREITSEDMKAAEANGTKVVRRKKS